MKYLFFDIECANCFNGKGKMIEFGYTLTDKDFNVIRKDTFVMNPGKEKFDKGIYKRDPSFEFAYDYDYYYDQPEFPKFYNKIKNLILDKDTKVLGYAIANDIRYLDYTCKRYKLKPLEYVSYDVQSMLHYYSCKVKHFPGLSIAAKSLVAPEELMKLSPHLSEDDACMTMLVLKEMCKHLEITLEEMIDVCPESRIDSKEYLFYVMDKRKHPENYITKSTKIKINDKAVELCRELFARDFELSKKEESKGKLVTISAFIKSNLEATKQLIETIKSKEFIATGSIDESDYLIVYNDKDCDRIKQRLRRPYEGKIITIEEFEAI